MYELLPVVDVFASVGHMPDCERARQQHERNTAEQRYLDEQHDNLVEIYANGMQELLLGYLPSTPNDADRLSSRLEAVGIGADVDPMTMTKVLYDPLSRIMTRIHFGSSPDGAVLTAERQPVASILHADDEAKGRALAALDIEFQAPKGSDLRLTKVGTETRNTEFGSPSFPKVNPMELEFLNGSMMRSVVVDEALFLDNKAIIKVQPDPHETYGPFARLGRLTQRGEQVRELERRLADAIAQY